MRRLLIIMIVCLLLSVKSAAVDMPAAQAELFETDSLWQGLSGEAKDFMEHYSPSVQADLGTGLTDILTDAVGRSGGIISATCRMMFRILAIVVLCKFAGTTGDTKAVFAAGLAGTMAITVSCAADLRSMIGLGQNTVEEINSFTTLLLPVLTAAATASGAASSAAASYGVAAVFCDLLVRLCRLLLVPLVYCFLGLGVADCALNQNRLGKLRELVAWTIKFVLKGILYGFTGFLGATRVVSGVADAAALKAAKLTISGMVPVVGSIVSDASESLLAGAGLLKSAIGTFGMLAVVSIFIMPFLQMGISYLGFKLVTALSGVLECGQEKLLETLASAMGFMLAMAGSCTAMALVSCCCLVKVSLL